MDDNRQIGRYRLVRRVAVGGQAEVFLADLAQAHGITRRCIVKRILPDLAAKPEFAQSFIDEAGICARLSHPNLVTTLDFDEIDGNLFMAFEYVDGPDLWRLCDAMAKEGARMPIEAACFIMTGVLRGLGFAHDAVDENNNPLLIVHRDINPPNIFLSTTGAVKLGDFGIARASGRMTVTRFGHLKGKIPYMSPEQAEGKKPDRRSDLFSCGIVLFELITGGRLFTGAGDMEVLRQVRESVIPLPSSFRPDLFYELDEICKKALARRPEDRYQTADLFLKDLEKFLTRRYPAFKTEQLADLIGQYSSHWQRGFQSRKKTAVLAPGVKESVPRPPQDDAKMPARLAKRTWRYALGVLLAVVAATGIWFVFIAGEKNAGAVPEAFAGPTGFVEMSPGPASGFVFHEDRLLGRSPLMGTVPAANSPQPIRITLGGIADYRRGSTIRQGATRFLDGHKRVLRTTGTLVFPDSIPKDLFLDGREVRIDEPALKVGSGWHHISWKTSEGLESRFVPIGPGQVFRLSLLFLF